MKSLECIEHTSISKGMPHWYVAGTEDSGTQQQQERL